jgi:mannose-6-phosphate isomerase-like protein (cupin superfamily)
MHEARTVVSPGISATLHAMNPVLIEKPSRVAAAGTKPKLIDEYIGRVNSETKDLSVAQMRSPGGWIEPGQTPEFDEYTVVLRGLLRVEYAGGSLDVHAGQAVISNKGEWVRYSTPEPEGAEYIAVCSPAFTLDAAHRDPE